MALLVSSYLNKMLINKKIPLISLLVLMIYICSQLCYSWCKSSFSYYYSHYCPNIKTEIELLSVMFSNSYYLEVYLEYVTVNVRACVQSARVSTSSWRSYHGSRVSLLEISVTFHEVMQVQVPSKQGGFNARYKYIKGHNITPNYFISGF